MGRGYEATTPEEIIREWTLRVVLPILDNNGADLYYRVQEVAEKAILEDGSVSDANKEDDYRRASRGGDIFPYAQLVGTDVRHFLRETLDEWYARQGMESGHWVREILDGLLDLQDSRMRDMIGEHYLPDPDDVTWPDTGTDDNDDDDDNPSAV